MPPSASTYNGLGERLRSRIIGHYATLFSRLFRATRSASRVRLAGYQRLRDRMYEEHPGVETADLRYAVRAAFGDDRASPTATEG
jgi:hypothetical protein